jgi:putative FmdB family regulatory protein
MPLRDIQCRDCGHLWEEVLKYGQEPEPCPHCGSTKLDNMINAHGGYSMSSGGSSTKPRHASSFAGRKK